MPHLSAHKFAALPSKKEILFHNGFEDGTTIIGTPDPAYFSVGTNMKTEIGTGTPYTWLDEPNKGLTGAKTLNVSGKVWSAAHARNIIFDGLNVFVSPDTHLQYGIFPAMCTDHYDFDFLGTYLAIDLKFSDGTYLSQTGLRDRHGSVMSAAGQGEAKTLFTHQWNLVTGKIGEVAHGKTITAILVTFDFPAAPRYNVREFVTYFDDITIFNQAPTEHKTRLDYVTTLLGTNDTPGFSRGLTSSGATLPGGFNMFAPANNPRSSKLLDYFKPKFSSITITHEPSIWIGDRGTWQFLTSTRLNASSCGSFGVMQAKNTYKHKNEVAKPHYYGVSFDENDGDAAGSAIELVPSMHGAVVRFSFDESAENRSVIFDSICAPGGGEFNDDGSFTAHTEHKSHGSAKMYIYGRFNQIPESVATCENIVREARDNRPVEYTTAGIATFSAAVVEMKIATSFISPEQAERNYKLELENKTFDDVGYAAQKAWEDKLSIFDEIKGGTEAQLESIYSALYFLYKYPTMLSEDTEKGMKYRSPYSGNVEDGILYYNNGFWDTYRTVWPGYHLFTPNLSTAYLNGIVRHYTDSGWVPRWIAPGGVNCMVGTSSDVIFADAQAKGVKFDLKNAYDSSVRNASVFAREPRNGGRTMLHLSPFLGYTPGPHEDFSWSMEGYINDFGIASMASALVKSTTDPVLKAKYQAEAKYFAARSKNYPLLFWSTGEDYGKKWFRGREADGKFTHHNDTEGVFDPLFWGSDFTETDAYNMSVTVPFDGEGLIGLYQGKGNYESKIDSIFTTCAPYKGYGSESEHDGIHEQREAREVKLGRYGHNNQPSHHIAYMYDYANPPKAQFYARDIMRRLYVGTDFGQGFPGDEDNGEMSCWLLLSSLGFYPLAVGRAEYAIGSPLFHEVTLKLDNGQTLRVIANNNSIDNVYVQSLTVNGKPWHSTALPHSEIAHGGELIFTMGPAPSDWAHDAPPTSVTGKGNVPEPLVDIVKTENVTSTVTDAAALFDNNSKTAVNVSTGDTITITAGTSYVPTLWTVTSAAEGVAPSATLYGIKDGGKRVKIAATDNLGFTWAQYTRPFEITVPAAYESYVVEFTSAGSLSEIELLTNMPREAAQSYLGIEH